MIQKKVRVWTKRTMCCWRKYLVSNLNKQEILYQWLCYGRSHTCAAPTTLDLNACWLRGWENRQQLLMLSSVNWKIGISKKTVQTNEPTRGISHARPIYALKGLTMNSEKLERHMKAYILLLCDLIVLFIEKLEAIIFLRLIFGLLAGCSAIDAVTT